VWLMDPFTIATVVATLLATKAVEKIGEKLGEGTIVQGSKLLESLQRKSPATVKRLAAANPEVIDAEIVEEIVEEVKRVAAAEPEVQAAVDATAAAIESDPIGFQHLTKLAEKIGVANLAKVENQTNNITI
jgi:hypothetical protein